METLSDLLERLLRSNAKFVLIGGYCAILHGARVVTDDIDVVAPLDDENLQKIFGAFADLNPRARMRPDKFISMADWERFRGHKNLYFDTAIGVVDVLGEVPDFCDYKTAEEKSVVIDFGGLPCRVLDIDTLIAVKSKVGRPQDLLAVKLLKSLKDNPGLFDHLPG